MSQSPSTIFNNLLSDIYDRILENYELDKFIIELGNINRKVRTDEVLLYLQIMHSVALTEICGALVDHGLEQENQNSFNKLEPKSLANSLVKLIQADDDVEVLRKCLKLGIKF